MGVGASDMADDPAVSALAELPAELIEMVALSVADEASLRALASTNRRIRSILHPRFLDMFTIECALAEPALWDSLAARPKIPGMIRHLTIDPRLEPRPKGRIPAWITSSALQASPDADESTGALAAAISLSSLSPTLESEREDEAKFTAALRHMNHLSKLIWRHNPPHDPDHVWTTLLAHCGHLTDLEIADRDAGALRGERKVREPLPSIHLSRLATRLDTFPLTRLVWYTSAYDANDVIISKLGPLEDTLVNGCPYLEELRIRQCSPHVVNYAGTLLSRAFWPRLRILELAHFHAGDCEAVAAFFARHPLIHTLILDQNDFTSGQFVDLEEIKDDALPLLEVLCAGIDNVNAVLRAGTRTKLRRIYGLQFDTQMRRARRPTTWSSSGEGARLLEGLARTPSLRELEGEFAVVIADKLDLVRLFASCTNLTSLKVRCSFAGLLESYLPAFAYLKHIKSIDLPLQHFDVLPSANVVHGSLTMRMGSERGFLTPAGSGGSPLRGMSSIPTPWSNFGGGSPGGGGHGSPGGPTSNRSLPHSPSLSSFSPGSNLSPHGGSGSGGGPTSFVSGLLRRVRMIAEVCPELETVRFGGGGMTGLARVVRYAGSSEVSSVELGEEEASGRKGEQGRRKRDGDGRGDEDEDGGREESLRLTRCKASGWAPYGLTEPGPM